MSTSFSRAALCVEAASPADCGPLAALARRVFTAAFAASTPPSDMAAFLDATYRPELFAADLDDRSQHLLVARHGAALVGFSQLRDGPPPACVVGPDVMELQRLYVDLDWHGRGAAQMLMGRASQEACRRGATTWWLGVWEGNLRAQRFYRRCGLQTRGTRTFLVGGDAQTDLVMQGPLLIPSPG